MKATTSDGVRIKALKRIIGLMAHAADDVIIKANRNTLEFKSIGGNQNILLGIEFASQYFDEYEFHLSDPIIRSVSLRTLSTVLKCNKSMFLVLQIVNNEKIIIISKDIFGIQHTYNVYLEDNTYSDLVLEEQDSNTGSCFSTIECSTDIFNGAGKCFESTSDVSKFKLSKSSFRIETGENTYKPEALYIVTGSDQCRIYSRFKTKLNVVFNDIMISTSIADSLSKKMQIKINEEGPIVISTTMGIIAKMSSTIAASVNDTEETDDIDEDILTIETKHKKKKDQEPVLTAPTSENLNARSTIRAEAIPFRDIVDIPKRRRRRIVPIDM